MIAVLRMGHRKSRDARLSTHCGLIARALGADEIIYSGEEDSGLLESIKRAGIRWGGKFSVSYEKNWRNTIEKFRRRKFLVVHLSMFGIPIQEKINTVRNRPRVLVLIGSEKVPGEVYGLSDLNLAVTSQPHSEAAALAIFLHEYFSGKELAKKFPGAEIRIVPQEHGKKTLIRSKR